MEDVRDGSGGQCVDQVGDFSLRSGQILQNRETLLAHS
jgi:hypothetical protein